MTVEIRKGETVEVGGVELGIAEFRVSPFANREGSVETRRSAVLTVGAEEVEVAEGSVVTVGSGSFIVVRIVRKRGRPTVRLRGTEEGVGRFAPVLAGFMDRGEPFDASMAFLVQGVNLVNDVVGRIDEHPDTVGSFAEPLKRAHKYLQHARLNLADAGASPALLKYAEQYIAVCEPLIEIIMSSTQEREIDE